MSEKTIYFIRHGKLNLPYKDHSEMPIDVLADLASQKLNPPIDTEHTGPAIQELSQQIPFEKINVIYASPSSRCQSTAKIIAEQLTQQPHVVSLENLQEVHFDLVKLLEEAGITKDNFELSLLNELVLKGIINSPNCEPIQSCQQRINTFFQQILSSEHEHILCVAHDFVMRVIELYIKNQGATSEYTEEAILNTHHNGYLKGFVTNDKLEKISYID